MTNYDAILLLSFGGPEHRDHVIAFLENVLRGKPVPRERLLEVAEHYYHFDGISPINQQCRDLITALRVELDQHDIRLPIYWGNRNWEPYLAETARQMHADGVRRAITFVTSAFSSYSGCRQYRENIAEALAQPGCDDLHIDKLRVFYNHPDFVQVVAERVADAHRALGASSPDQAEQATSAFTVFTAHSIPMSMASSSDYERQLVESCRLVTDVLAIPRGRWEMVYQSRSGRPGDPWLEPDIIDFLGTLKARGESDVVVSPIGFLSDHMEVLYDLDDEARRFCDANAIRMVRAATPGVHPVFVSLIRKLIAERLLGAPRECTGMFPANHDVCPVDCCPAPARR